MGKIKELPKDISGKSVHLHKAGLSYMTLVYVLFFASSLVEFLYNLINLGMKAVLQQTSYGSLRFLPPFVSFGQASRYSFYFLLIHQTWNLSILATSLWSCQHASYFAEQCDSCGPTCTSCCNSVCRSSLTVSSLLSSRLLRVLA